MHLLGGSVLVSSAAELYPIVLKPSALVDIFEAAKPWEQFRIPIKKMSSQSEGRRT